MLQVTIVIPVYNAERYLESTLRSALDQTYANVEILAVNDGSTDGSRTICEAHARHGVRTIHQQNRGISGARNTGIRNASGDLIAFLDADDLWHPEKLERHVEHFQHNPGLGASYSHSEFIDEHGESMRIHQVPKTSGVTPLDLLCRTPIGNGSAGVFSRELFDDIGFEVETADGVETHYFDETLAESQDVECWMRVAVLTDWRMEGIAESLTKYRVHAGGVSADLPNKLAAWEVVLDRVRTYAPDQMKEWEGPARAYHSRHLARRAVTLGDGRVATRLLRESFREHPRILLEEPQRTFVTMAAAGTLRVLPTTLYEWAYDQATALNAGLHPLRSRLRAGMAT